MSNVVDFESYKRKKLDEYVEHFSLENLSPEQVREACELLAELEKKGGDQDANV